MENKVLIINTGGTIGMVGKPLRPAYNWAEITKGYSVLEKFPTDYYQFEKLNNCELIIVESVGHSPFTEKMAKVLIKFLEDNKNSY